ncbi:MAG: zinc-dependent peptidase [Comamonadaceae bacterium]|nr:MAG: zinc-dependent peptidase [Comamonadaceae bacterium]
MFAWLRRLRPVPAIPDRLWQATLDRYAFLGDLPADDRGRLRRLSAEFLRDKRFHGVGGFVISDAVALAIAAQAVLPVLDLPDGLGWYDDFVGIVVHPSEVVAHRSIVDEAGVLHEYDEVVAGEAMERGPVMLSWQDVAAGARTIEAGYNVVIHEFAHKLDMRNGPADGCPPLPPGFGGKRTASEALASWRSMMQTAYARFREQTLIAERFGGEAPWLDAYGAQSIAEFFAVACEAYFVNRAAFAEAFPELLEGFDGFFHPHRESRQPSRPPSTEP